MADDATTIVKPEPNQRVRTLLAFTARAEAPGRSEGRAVRDWSALQAALRSAFTDAQKMDDVSCSHPPIPTVQGSLPYRGDQFPAPPCVSA